MSDIGRFLDAQDGTYDRALQELRAGRKTSHWMWFIFPQIAGLGRSDTARLFAIADRSEAADYASHPVLGTRLAECTDAMLAWAGQRSVESILGSVDAMKFRSSMTLFNAVASGTGRYARALDAFYDGEPDEATVARI